MYIITEKYDGNVSTQPTFDSVFVTDPTGAMLSYSIPHQLINISEHNAQLSQIINNVISLGYKNNFSYTARGSCKQLIT